MKKNKIAIVWCAIAVMLSQVFFVYANAEESNEVENTAGEEVTIAEEAAKGITATSLNKQILEIYHVHTGNANTYGKCYADGTTCGNTGFTAEYYEKKIGSHLIEIYPGAYGWANDYETCFGGYKCTRCGTTYATHPGTCNHSYGYACTCTIPTDVSLGTITVTAGNKDWTKEDIIIRVDVDIKNENLVLDTSPYSFDGGNTWQAENTITITENGTYTVCVKTFNGDIYTQEVVVDYIDKTGPSLEVSYDTAEFLHETTLTVISGDSQSGLEDNPYSFDGGSTWQSEAFKSIIENGIYSVMVKDKVGNETMQLITVSNLDNQGPALCGYTLTPDSLTEEKVVITIEGEDYQDELVRRYEKTVTEDILGNQLEENEVTQADTDTAGEDELPPEGVLGCGLSDIPYSWDQGRTWTDCEEHGVTDNGQVEVWLADKMDNITVAYIPVTNIINAEEEKKKTEEEKTTEEVEELFQGGSVSNSSESLPLDNSSDEKKRKEHDEFKNLEEDSNGSLVDSDTYLLAENNSIPNRTIGVKRLDRVKKSLSLPVTLKEVLKAAGIVGGIVGIPIGIFFLFVCVIRRAGIYEQLEDGKFHRLGTALLEEEEDYFLAKIDQSILEKGETTKYRLVLSRLFARRHNSEELVIESGQTLKISVLIEHYIYFQTR